MKNRPSITKEEDKRNKEISYHENETQGYVIDRLVPCRNSIRILLWIVGEMTGIIEHRGM